MSDDDMGVNGMLLECVDVGWLSDGEKQANNCYGN